jgi:hypothetical protein
MGTHLMGMHSLGLLFSLPIVKTQEEDDDDLQKTYFLMPKTQ